MISRTQYMADSDKLHRSYYAQLAIDEMREQVKRHITVERIKASTDEHFNDIPMEKWDALSGLVFMRGQVVVKPRVSHEFAERCREAEEGGVSPATLVCVYKEIAQQIKEEHEYRVCMFPNCTEDATRWYEQANGKEFYYCMEHPEADAWKETGMVIRPEDQKEVESAVYSCGEACEVCNQ